LGARRRCRPLAPVEHSGIGEHFEPAEGMEALARKLAALFIAEHGQVDRVDVRARYGMLQGWISAGGALTLAGAKLALGLSLQSAGLVADAVHSLTDVAASAMVILGFHLARRPPDREHPFGHAKMEYVATLVLAILMAVAGFELGQANGMRLLRGEAAAELPPLTLGALAALLLLMAAGEAAARLARAMSRLIDSRTLEADAWHSRSDVLATGIVVVGVAGRNFGLPWLDAAAGAAVGGFIVATSLRLAVNAISPLLGETALHREIETMHAIAAEVPGVVNIHDLAVHKYGHFYFTAVHMEVSDRLDSRKMHEIAVQLETRILKRFPGECVVHADPIDLSHPLYFRVSHALRDVVIRHPHLVEFHDLALWSDNGRDRGDVEVSVSPHVPGTEHAALSGQVKDALCDAFPRLDLEIRLKVDFTAVPLRA